MAYRVVFRRPARPGRPRRKTGAAEASSESPSSPMPPARGGWRTTSSPTGPTRVIEPVGSPKVDQGRSQKFQRPPRGKPRPPFRVSQEPENQRGESLIQKAFRLELARGHDQIACDPEVARDQGIRRFFGREAERPQAMQTESCGRGSRAAPRSHFQYRLSRAILRFRFAVSSNKDPLRPAMNAS